MTVMWFFRYFCHIEVLLTALLLFPFIRSANTFLSVNPRPLRELRVAS